MSPVLKILIGFAAALLAGWISHGPLGRGEVLVDRLEAEVRAAVAKAELPSVQVRLGRDPLTRTALLSGQANDLQREGMGGARGVNDYVREVEGISALRWADAPSGGTRIIPLILETLSVTTLAYLLGLALGWLLWGRRREGFL